MSINKSLYIGLTGMNANAEALNTIGNNIANMNTVGFKAGRTQFQEMLGQSLMTAGGTAMSGGGTGLAGVSTMFNQGSLIGTGVGTNLGVAGEGFFALQGEVDGTTGTFYSRAGSFDWDKEGFLTSPQGLKLMGYPANESGEIASTLAPIQKNDAPIPPQATSEGSLSVNLSASAKNQEAGFDPFADGAKSDLSETVTVYDSLGKSYQVDVHYYKDENGTWNYKAGMDGKHVDGGQEGVFQEVGSGQLAFDDKGKLTTDPATLSIGFTPANGSADIAAAVDMKGTTQFEGAGVSTTIAKNMNGSQSGTFQGVSIDVDGTIMGTFSNGEQRVLGKVGMARFMSNQGLSQMGGGLYAESAKSGSVIMGGPNQGGMGSIRAGMLEQSNVDLASEFTQMIVAQRGYQANSRSITTADQMMQEAVNLKR